MHSFLMKNAVLISELAASAAATVRRAESEGVVPVARHGRTVAFIVGREKMAALLETMELQRNDELMQLIRADRASELRFKDVP